MVNPNHAPEEQFQKLTTASRDDVEASFRAACETWLQGSSGRDVDSMAQGQIRDLATRLAFAGRDDGVGTLTLPRRTRGGGGVALVASRPEPDETTSGDAAPAGPRTASSLRVAARRANGSEAEIFAVDATATGAPPKWTKLQVRTSCDGGELIALRDAVAPMLSEVADLLDLLLALPWLPPTDLFPHIRNRLMEDLLVDLCELEGSDSDGPPDDEAEPEPPAARKKKARAAD